MRSLSIPMEKGRGPFTQGDAVGSEGDTVGWVRMAICTQK